MDVGDSDCGKRGLTWRNSVALASWILALSILLSAPAPANAEPSGFFDWLFSGGDQGETSPADGVTEEPGEDPPASGIESACPGFAIENPDLAAACGTDRPPVSHAMAGDISGAWEVEAPGSPHIEALTVVVNRGFHGLGYRNIVSPLVATTVVRYPGDIAYRHKGINIGRSEDGTITAKFGGFEYCSCVSIYYHVKPTGDPNVMTGEWVYLKQRGVTIWRRQPPGDFRSVSYTNITADPSQRFVRDYAAFGTRSLKIERTHPVTCGYGHMRGNCGGIWVIISGDNLAGGHDVWVDPASQIEIEKAGWICSNGKYRDYGAEWTSCGSKNAPGDGVVGLFMRVLFWDGMTPGPKTLWVDGRPIHLEMTIHGYPEEEKIQEPALLLLDALNAQGEQIRQIEEGVPFILKTVYDGAHPDTWVSIDVLDMKSAQASDNAEKWEVILRRTDDPKIFQSDWLAVEPGPEVK